MLTSLLRRAGTELRSLDVSSLPQYLLPGHRCATNVVTEALEAVVPPGLQCLKLDTNMTHNLVKPAQLLRLRAACSSISFDEGMLWCQDSEEGQDCFQVLQEALRSLPSNGDVLLFLSRYGDSPLPMPRMHDFALSFASFPVTSLVMAVCKLDDGAAAALARGLTAGNVLLRHLNMSHNDMGPTGADALARLIASCDSLEHLDVYNNDMLPEETLLAAARVRQAPLEIRYSLLAGALVGDQRLMHLMLFPCGGAPGAHQVL